MRMRLPGGITRPSAATIGLGIVAPWKRNGNVTVNVLPFPGSLSTTIEPPCSSTNFFTNGRPSPVPPYWRGMQPAVLGDFPEDNARGPAPMPIAQAITTTADDLGFLSLAATPLLAFLAFVSP